MQIFIITFNDQRGLRGVQSLVLFSSGYGTGENRQLGFGEISIFILSHIINNNRVGCGGGLSSLYFK